MSMLKAIDFCCGAGGMTYGLRKAGINVLGGVDIDAECGATYEKNNKGSRFLHADMNGLKNEDIESAFGVAANDPNLIFVGCVPCQHWTLLHTSRKKSIASKNLALTFARIVFEFNPGFVILENVPGFLKRAGSPLKRVLAQMEKKGYSYAHDVLNTADYGVAQNRHRYLLIASRVHQPTLPKPTIKRPRTVSDAIRDFVPIAAGHRDESKLFHSSRALSETNLARIRATPTNGGSRLAWKNDHALRVPAYENTLRGEVFADVYSRMYWERPAPTITTKFPSFSNGRFGHPEQNRAISIREGAALQSFPNSYQFVSDHLGTAARMIGNAVPPLFAKAIGRALIGQIRK